MYLFCQLLRITAGLIVYISYPINTQTKRILIYCLDLKSSVLKSITLKSLKVSINDGIFTMDILNFNSKNRTEQKTHGI